MIEITIISNSKRQMIAMGNNVAVYIPMTKDEANVFAKNRIDPCWRINARCEVKKEKP